MNLNYPKWTQNDRILLWCLRLDCTEIISVHVFDVFSRFYILFIGFISNFFSKIFIKIESYNIIYTFKNYFITIFLIFNFQ